MTPDPPEPAWWGAVAAGSAVGAVSRYLVSLGTLQFMGPGLPWGTLVVNVTGSFLIGYVATVTETEGRFPAGPAGRHFWMAGFCGGLTTFSIFSLEVVALLTQGRGAAAALVVGLSLLLWVPGCWAGQRMAAGPGRAAHP